MLHDVIVVGAGPVGASLALSLAGADLDIVVLDARPESGFRGSDRSLALSHGLLEGALGLRQGSTPGLQP